MSAEGFNLLWEQMRGNVVSIIKSKLFLIIILISLWGAHGKALALSCEILHKIECLLPESST